MVGWIEWKVRHMSCPPLTQFFLIDSAAIKNGYNSRSFNENAISNRQRKGISSEESPTFWNFQPPPSSLRLP